VNVKKDEFPFAAAAQIPKLMADFEEGPLRRHTPCRPTSIDGLAAALAEVHVELVLIHPFREGNGRAARILAVLMGLQAGVARSFVRQVIRQETAPVFCCGASGASSRLRSHDHTIYRGDREDFTGSREEVRRSEVLGSERKSAEVSFTPSISVEVYTVI
jgi:Fic/DOC family